MSEAKDKTGSRKDLLESVWLTVGTWTLHRVSLPNIPIESLSVAGASLARFVGTTFLDPFFGECQVSLSLGFAFVLSAAISLPRRAPTETAANS